MEYGSFISAFLFWIVYFVLHSLLAAGWIKTRFGARFPAIAAYYRLLYNIFAIALFIVGARLFDYRNPVWFQPRVYLTAAGAGLALVGGWIAWKSFEQYDLREFVGLKRSEASIDQLQTSGMNRLVRHPLYLATVMMLLGLWLVIPSVGISAFIVSAFVYLPVGIYWEEKKLLAQFGADYEVYCRHTSRIFPGIW